MARLAYEPVVIKPEVASAIQALERGDCPEHLQKIALKFIIEDASATHDQSYFGNSDDTIFREGRRFVGNTVVKCLKLDPSKLRSEDG